MLLKCFGSFPSNFQPTITCPNHHVSNYMNMSNEFKVKSKKYFEHIQQINILFSLLTLNRSLLTETCITNKCLQGTIILWENVLLKKKTDTTRSIYIFFENKLNDQYKTSSIDVNRKQVNSFQSIVAFHIETRNSPYRN